MKEKDNSKCKEWERRRREKLNDAFKCLCQLLPNYDPAKNLPKIDILERSTEFVKELRLSNSRLLSQQAETDEKCKMIKELQDEVNKLILRVKQLTALLKQASIAIPLGPSIKSLGKKKLKWSNKLTPENLENNSNPITVSVPSIETGKNIETDNTSSSAGDSASATPTLTNPLKETICNVPITEKEPVSTGTNTSSSQPHPPNIFEINKANNNVQMPLQTIFLTSCPIAPVANQAPQMITRIALGPTRILPKPLDGISPLHKIAIRPIRKPLPPKEKKRRNRKKKIPIEKVDAETQSKTDETREPNKNSQNSETIAEPVVNKASNAETGMVKESETLVGASESKSTEEPIVTNIDQEPESVEMISNTETILEPENTSEPADTTSHDVERESIVETVDVQLTNENTDEIVKTQSKLVAEDSIMEVALNISHEVEISAQVEKDTDKQTTSAEVDSINVPTIKESEKTNEVEINSIPEPEVAQAEILSKECETNYMDISEFSQPKTVTAIPVETPQSSSEEDEGEADTEISSVKSKVVETSGRDEESERTNIEHISVENQGASSTINDPVAEDKISECIARSIDLIDGPDRELMELADNWGENVNSPKSPISPTQMFLNMFPLLPRDMIVAVSENSQPGQSKSTYSSHRSFFIDSMLPDGHSENSNMENTVIASLNTVSSSIVPLPSEPQNSTFRLTEISPLNPTQSSNSKANVSESGSISQVSTVHTPSNSQVPKPQESKTPTPAQKPTQTHQTSKESSLFEFSNFQPPMYMENVFRDATRNRNPTDCRHASSSSVPLMSSSGSTLSSTNSASNFGPPPASIQNTSFQINQKQTSGLVPTNTHPHPHFIHQDLRHQEPLIPASSNLIPHPTFPSQTPTFTHHPSHSQSSTISSCRPTNQISNPTSLQETVGTFSYSVDNNLRHSFTEQAKQPTNKPQFFRPPVQDFQPQPMFQNFQHSSVSNPKNSSNKTVASKTVSSESHGSKRQKLNENIQPSETVQPSQPHGQQIQKPPYSFISNFSNAPPIQSQSKSSVLHPNYPAGGSHTEKQVSQSQTSRNYQQPKPPVAVPAESSKSYQKSSNKEPTQSLSTPSPTCQSRRQQNQSHSLPVPIVPANPIATSLNSSINTNLSHHNQPLSIERQQTRRPESNSRIHSQAVASFPDFSLSTNFNQSSAHAYEPYNVNYHPAGNQHNPQSNPVPQARKNTRPTPFYLQDVQTHCESFNFETSSNNALQNQQSNQPFNPAKPHYSSNPPLHPSSISTASVPHYFPSSSQSQSQSSCQNTYSHQNSPNISSRSHQHHIDESSLLYHQTPNQNANQHRQAINQTTKTKPAASTSSQAQHNPTDYANQAGLNVSNSNTPSNPASRPVNWMTDTPYRTNKSNPNIANSAPTAAANPFSVSKLVGNNSTQSNTNIPNSSTGGSNTICINRNTSYCAEALIRKNPSWNNLNFSSSSTPANQLAQPASTSCISYQSTNLNTNEHLNFPNYSTNFSHHTHYANITNATPSSNSNNSSSGTSGNSHLFNHFDPVQHNSSNPHHSHHQQYNFPQPHGSHHQHHQAGHHHGTTSVSNFNLSSIFPEINDKRQASSNNNSNSNINSGTGSNNSCGYYPSSHGNARK